MSRAVPMNKDRMIPASAVADTVNAYLLDDVRDVIRIIAISTDAWDDDDEHMASSCTGVLNILGYKLKLIEGQLEHMVKCTAVPNGRRAS